MDEHIGEKKHENASNCSYSLECCRVVEFLKNIWWRYLHVTDLRRLRQGDV